MWDILSYVRQDELNVMNQSAAFALTLVCFMYANWYSYKSIRGNLVWNFMFNGIVAPLQEEFLRVLFLECSGFKWQLVWSLMFVSWHIFELFSKTRHSLVTLVLFVIGLVFLSVFNFSLGYVEGVVWHAILNNIVMYVGLVIQRPIPPTSTDIARKKYPKLFEDLNNSKSTLFMAENEQNPTSSNHLTTLQSHISDC